MTYFPSKRDRWFALICWGLMPGTLLSIIVAWFVAPPKDGLLIFLLAGVLPILLCCLWIIWMWYGVGYTVSDSELVVKATFLTWRIPLAAITRVKRSRNILSSPALSLDRVEVRWGKGQFILISPEDQEEFFDLLRLRCPQAQFPA